ncbi:hypothetical protein PHG01_00034 [Streptococcus mutans PKUSS-HG01]|nr:hypothetical protein PHG01_00034 [Streptococcus mutans PKUSS-HG01]
MQKLAFPLANTIQSLCFALIHGFMFLKLLDVGSIVPSWLIHAAANIFSGLCAAFMLI